MTEQEYKFLKGYNDGYLLKEHDPELLMQILKILSPQQKCYPLLSPMLPFMEILFGMHLFCHPL